MGKHVLWAVLIGLWVTLFLTEGFPERLRPPPAAMATVEWQAPDRAAPLAVDEVTDLATCQEMQRRVAARRDGESRVTVACKGPL
ncbi:MAG TPA: hypothetical protein VE397_18460 [Stellaceae bacterium]|jgi:hypothetical protein|nr:hypothetical protein [Stellaceae bacterium]